MDFGNTQAVVTHFERNTGPTTALVVVGKPVEAGLGIRAALLLVLLGRNTRVLLGAIFQRFVGFAKQELRITTFVQCVGVVWIDE